jgi:hypothetical protein
VQWPCTLLTFVMATTPLNALIARITDRMLAILVREAWAALFGGCVTGDETSRRRC